jgi:hypothetical protein
MVSLTPVNYLKNYRWKLDPEKTDYRGVVYVHDKHPDSEIYLWDDGRVEHLVGGHIVATMNQKDLKNYLARFHKY